MLCVMASVNSIFNSTGYMDVRCNSNITVLRRAVSENVLILRCRQGVSFTPVIPHVNKPIPELNGTKYTNLILIITVSRT